MKLFIRMIEIEAVPNLKGFVLVDENGDQIEGQMSCSLTTEIDTFPVVTVEFRGLDMWNETQIHGDNEPVKIIQEGEIK